VVKKATKSTGVTKKKTKAVESYKIYIYKVLKQVIACPALWLKPLQRSSEVDTSWPDQQGNGEQQGHKCSCKAF